MPTVTIRLDDETDDRLKRRLARSGETLSEFIRAAVVSRLDAAPRRQSRLASLTRVLEAVSDTGDTDLSTTYKSQVKERLRAKYNRR